MENWKKSSSPTPPLKQLFFLDNYVSSSAVDLANDFVVFLYQKDAYMQLKSTT